MWGDILSTGELAPKASITYAGEYEIKKHTEVERTRRSAYILNDHIVWQV
jgi:hypothetical protein